MSDETVQEETTFTDGRAMSVAAHHSWLSELETKAEALASVTTRSNVDGKLAEIESHLNEKIASLEKLINDVADSTLTPPTKEDPSNVTPPRQF